jgi:hypothetical protein
MTLGDKQRLFGKLFPMLIMYAHTLDFEVAISYCKRCEDCQVGHRRSCHKFKLAGDLDLFKDRKYLTKLAGDLDLFKDRKYLTKTEDHRELGEFWEKLHPLCRWGGRFGDGNHYSIEHGGTR